MASEGIGADAITMLTFSGAPERINATSEGRKAGAQSTNIVKVNALDCLSHEAIQGTQPCLATNSASKVPDAGTDHGSDCTGSEPSPAEASHGRKRRRENKDVSLSSNFKGLPQGKTDPTQLGPTALEKQPRGGMRRQDQIHMASGKPDLGPSTNVAAVLRSEAPCQRSSTAIKRPLFPRGIRPIVKQSQGTVAQRMDIMVISDTEREPSEEGNK